MMTRQNIDPYRKEGLVYNLDIGEYEIQAILDFTVMYGQKYYEVKWKGYSSKYNTFEPVSNLSMATEDIQIFQQNFHHQQQTQAKIAKEKKRSKKKSKELNIEEVRQLLSDNQSKKLDFLQRIGCQWQTQLQSLQQVLQILSKIQEYKDLLKIQDLSAQEKSFIAEIIRQKRYGKIKCHNKSVTYPYFSQQLDSQEKETANKQILSTPKNKIIQKDKLIRQTRSSKRNIIKSEPHQQSRTNKMQPSDGNAIKQGISQQEKMQNELINPQQSQDLVFQSICLDKIDFKQCLSEMEQQMIQQIETKDNTQKVFQLKFKTDPSKHSYNSRQLFTNQIQQDNKVNRQQQQTKQKNKEIQLLISQPKISQTNCNYHLFYKETSQTDLQKIISVNNQFRNLIKFHDYFKEIYKIQQMLQNVFPEHLLNTLPKQQLPKIDRIQDGFYVGNVMLMRVYMKNNPNKWYLITIESLVQHYYRQIFEHLKYLKQEQVSG